jgi:protein SCO1/2
MSKRVLFFSAVLMLLLVGGLAWTGFIQPYKFHGSVLQSPKLEGNIVLRSATGPVQLSDHRGEIVLLYFGYTYCPDVCPTSLAKLKAALSGLSPKEAAQVQVIFISVDPARDTPEELEQYAQTFGSDFIGAKGRPTKSTSSPNHSVFITRSTRRTRMGTIQWITPPIYT